MSDNADSKRSPGAPPRELVWAKFDRSIHESRMEFETATNLRCYLSKDFTKAQTWDDLIVNLSAKGFYLNFDGDRLVLVNQHTGIQLCTCQYLGFPFAELTKELGKPNVIADTGRVISAPKAMGS